MRKTTKDLNVGLALFVLVTVGFFAWSVDPVKHEITSSEVRD